MLYEGVVIKDGVLIHKTRPLSAQNYVINEAEEWAESNGYWNVLVCSVEKE